MAMIGDVSAKFTAIDAFREMLANYSVPTMFGSSKQHGIVKSFVLQIIDGPLRAIIRADDSAPVKIAKIRRLAFALCQIQIIGDQKVLAPELVSSRVDDKIFSVLFTVDGQMHERDQQLEHFKRYYVQADEYQFPQSLPQDNIYLLTTGLMGTLQSLINAQTKSAQQDVTMVETPIMTGCLERMVSDDMRGKNAFEAMQDLTRNTFFNGEKLLSKTVCQDYLGEGTREGVLAYSADLIDDEEKIEYCLDDILNTKFRYAEFCKHFPDHPGLSYAQAQAQRGVLGDFLLTAMPISEAHQDERQQAQADTSMADAPQGCDAKTEALPRWQHFLNKIFSFENVSIQRKAALCIGHILKSEESFSFFQERYHFPLDYQTVKAMPEMLGNFLTLEHKDLGVLQILFSTRSIDVDTFAQYLKAPGLLIDEMCRMYLHQYFQRRGDRKAITPLVLAKIAKDFFAPRLLHCPYSRQRHELLNTLIDSCNIVVLAKIFQGYQFPFAATDPSGLYCFEDGAVSQIEMPAGEMKHAAVHSAASQKRILIGLHPTRSTAQAVLEVPFSLGPDALRANLMARMLCEVAGQCLQKSIGDQLLAAMVLDREVTLYDKSKPQHQGERVQLANFAKCIAGTASGTLSNWEVSEEAGVVTVRYKLEKHQVTKLLVGEYRHADDAYRARMEPLAVLRPDGSPVGTVFHFNPLNGELEMHVESDGYSPICQETLRDCRPMVMVNVEICLHYQVDEPEVLRFEKPIVRIANYVDGLLSVHNGRDIPPLSHVCEIEVEAAMTPHSQMLTRAGHGGGSSA